MILILCYGLNTMIRILVLLMALNALFTPVSFAAACASNMGQSSVLSSNLTSSTHSVTVEQNSIQQHAQMQNHCDNCTTMNHAGMSDMLMMDCDTDCSVSCAVASPVAITATSLSFANVFNFTKPVSGTLSFYTRTISPELQPPLV